MDVPSHSSLSLLTQPPSDCYKSGWHLVQEWEECHLLSLPSSSWWCTPPWGRNICYLYSAPCYIVILVHISCQVNTGMALFIFIVGLNEHTLAITGWKMCEDVMVLEKVPCLFEWEYLKPWEVVVGTHNNYFYWNPLKMIVCWAVSSFFHW